jgi:hypothetical protein
LSGGGFGFGAEPALDAASVATASVVARKSRMREV